MIRILAFCSCMLLLSSGASQAACRVLDAELQDGYAGPCVDGLAQGTGAAVGSAEYRGGFRAGRKHGAGQKTWPNGDRYEGSFANDRRNGRGVYVFGRGPWAGERYEGEFRDDRRHGEGVYRWASGDVYSGPWRDDRPSGAPTQMMQARASHEREVRAAVSVEGTRVCREMRTGIAAGEWIRGTVLEAEGTQVSVRIDDAGKNAHPIGSVALAAGAIVRDAALAWTPCW